MDGLAILGSSILILLRDLRHGYETLDIPKLILYLSQVNVRLIATSSDRDYR